MVHRSACAVALSLALCAQPALGAAASTAPAVSHNSIAAHPGAPDLPGTVAVSIRANRFYGSMANALADASQSPLLHNLVAPARALNPLQQLAYVQSRVTNNIRWISDATEWGQHDYWATASQTLNAGAGDDEDRAIVKMHALRALGFSPSDLFLTLARDRVGGPMTVLTARLGDHYYILDDTGGPPFVVESRSEEFQPILSFGWSGAWVHTSIPRTPLAAASSSYLHK